MKFSFDNVLYMYKQIDGVVMGSPLGPALANTFVRYYEEKLFEGDHQPIMYFRCMDDIFAMSKKKLIANCF